MFTIYLGSQPNSVTLVPSRQCRRGEPDRTVYVHPLGLYRSVTHYLPVEQTLHFFLFSSLSPRISQEIGPSKTAYRTNFERPWEEGVLPSQPYTHPPTCLASGLTSTRKGETLADQDTDLQGGR